MRNDVKVLRELARKYIQIVNDEHNAYRRKLHTAVNDNKMIRPVVLIDEIPWSQMNIDNELTLLCEDTELRGYELFMRKNLYQFKYFRADMIVRPYLPVQKVIRSTGIGIGKKENIIKADEGNNIVSHKYEDIFENHEAINKLHKAVITYDEEETLRRFNKIANIVGDILPVKIVGIDHLTLHVWDDISEYRGAEALLYDLLDEEEFSHELVEKLVEIETDIHNQYLKLGLFENDPLSLHCTALLNSTLHPEEDNKDFKNIWGRGTAQIFSSVSKSMHDEFEIEHVKKALGRCGLVYYGCCEPLDKKVDIIEKIENLRKISITPWADVDLAAEVISGRYVIASKPTPASVGMAKLDEVELKKEIGKILDACKRNSCSCDLVLKDISSVSYNPANIFRWEQIVMEMVENY